MSFGSFRTIEQVIAKYPLRLEKKAFLPEIDLEPSPYFIENLNFTLRQESPGDDEVFYRENLIAPFLQLPWQRHDKLKIWFQKKLTFDEVLFGEPDYFISYRADEVIQRLINSPLLAVIEAKKEDFAKGWAQCLAAMLACQKLNAADNHPNITVYGIVSTGTMWQFAKLEGQTFTQHILTYSVSNPARVLGLLDYLFNECEKQV